MGANTVRGRRGSVVPNPGCGHRLRRAVVANTDRPLEACDGGRRCGRHSDPRAPPRSGGDNAGYGTTSGPDCLTSSRPQSIERPPARHRPPSLPGPTPSSLFRVPHQRHRGLLANSSRPTGESRFTALSHGSGGWAFAAGWLSRTSNVRYSVSARRSSRSVSLLIRAGVANPCLAASRSRFIALVR
jgi:hypothetical protein